MDLASFPDDRRAALYTAIRACRAGREVLLAHFGKLEHVEKKFKAGLVSEADRNAEKTITEVLKKAYPRSEVLGEESAHLGAKVESGRGGPNGRWILDPLDGTTNYIHRFPVFCISLGLEISGRLEIAVIDVPMLNETYTAIRGQGAFVNGQPIRVSQTSDLGDALLATGFFAEDKPALAEQIKRFSSIVGEVRGIRRAGAAAYDLTQVARGVFDGFWEQNLSPWDVAAGQLLVEEAGGKVVTYDGTAHDPYQKSILAANPAMVEKILTCFKKSN